MEDGERSYKKVLFVPGFLRDEGRVARVSQILKQVQPIFEKAGWKIVVSNYYRGEPTDLPLDVCAGRVDSELFWNKYDAVIAHSMGGLILPQNIWRNIPVVVIEYSIPWRLNDNHRDIKPPRPTEKGGRIPSE